MWNWEKRPKNLEEAIEAEIENRITKKEGLTIHFFVDKKAEEEYENKQNQLKEEIRAKLLTEFEKSNKRKPNFNSTSVNLSQ